MRHTIDVLEALLRHWESLAYHQEAVARLLRRHPGFHQERPPSRQMPRDWRDLRSHLLEAQTGGTFDVGRFTQSGSAEQDMEESGFDLAISLPFMLWQWTSRSRRVFHLESDLQTTLEATSFHQELKAEDVCLPFDSFLISLEEPIRMPGPAGDDVFDAIMVFAYAWEGQSNLGFTLINNECRNLPVVSSIERKRIDDAIGRKDGTGAARKLDAASRRLSPRGGHPQLKVIVLRPGDLANLARYESENAQSKKAVVGRVARIVLGLTMYLQTLPARSPHRSTWTPPPRGSRDPKAVTDGSLICTVASMHRLTTEEREVLSSGASGKGAYELSAHFRRGYWRRPPGSGQDPTAPKIVHVRPTLVRRDRLQEGQVVGGSSTDLG